MATFSARARQRPPFAAGDRVTWSHQPPGSGARPKALAARVLRVDALRAVIGVAVLRRGTWCLAERHVAVSRLVPRSYRESEVDDLPQHLRTLSVEA